MKFALALLTSLLVGLISLTLVFPHTIALIREGYPNAVWPANGKYAIQNGHEGSLTFSQPKSTPTPRLLSLFEDSSGAAIVVLKDGQLLFEHYANGLDAQTEFNSYSMVKSLVGFLVIKAVSEGKVTQLDDPIGVYLPEISGSKIANISIKSLLDMRSGLAFEKSGSPDPNQATDKKATASNFNIFGNLARLHVEGPAKILADVELNTAMVGTFDYQNLNTALLGLMLEHLYGMPLDKLLYEQIWAPAGATSFKWRRYSKTERISPYCCLFTTPREWALVGHFILQNGTEDKLMSEKWHRYFLGLDLSPVALRDGEYRSQTRYDILDRPGEKLSGGFSYFLGQGGQITYLMPKSGLVVVRFGDKHQLLHSTLYEIGNIAP